MFDKPKVYNSLSDIFVEYLLLDMEKPSVQEQLLIKCYQFLYDKVSSDDDYLLFNVDIKFDKSGDCLTIRGNNLITSLWLIGVYPKYPNQLKDSLTYKHNNIDYIYNPKNKKLTIVRN